MPYFVLSYSSGRYAQRGFINELPSDIYRLLEEGYLLTIYDIGDNDPDDITSQGSYGEHPSFAFSSFPELCLGDFI
jgi:hypothetical protein